MHLQVSNFLAGEAILENIESHEKKLISIEMLIADMQSGKVVNVDENSEMQDVSKVLGEANVVEIRARHESAAAAKQLSSKVKWLNALKFEGVIKIEDKPWVRQIIEKISTTALKDEPRFAVSTLYKAELQIKKSQGDVLSLLPSYSRRGGAGKNRIDPRVESIISDAISSAIQGTRKIVIKEISQKVQEQIQELNKVDPGSQMTTPGYTTIDRRVKRDLSAYEICVRNEGKSRADRIYRHNGARITAVRPLEVSETDDIDTGVFLIDPRTQLPFGRAFMTNSIDQNSKVPMGFDLDHRYRSTQSAIAAILDSLLPKDTSRPEFVNQIHPWIGYGTCGMNIMDNATYNHTYATEKIQIDLEQILGWSRPYQPTDKSVIEYYNHVVKNSFCYQLSGWRGSKDNPEGAHEGMEGAIMSLDEFKYEYVSWVCGEYLNTAGGDGQTPKQRWMRHFSDHRPAVRYTREQIKFFQLTAIELKFRDSGGLLRLKLRYQSDELEILCKHLGKKSSVMAYCDPDNLKYILVKHPHTGGLLTVHCIENQNYIKDLTEHQQQLILKQCRENGKNNPSLKDCIDAREALAARTLQMSRNKRLLARKKSLVNHIPPMPMDVTDIEVGNYEPELRKSKSAKAPVLMTDLEYAIAQLDEIDLIQDEWDLGVSS